MNEDIIVCGVTEDKLIEDIGVMVPKGEVTPISALQANKSKDLHRLLSQGLIFRLNTNSLLRLRGLRPDSTPPVVNPSVTQLQEERDQLAHEVKMLQTALSQASAANVALTSENAQLRDQMKSLEVVIAGHTDQSSKLDTLLELVRSRPTTVQVVAGQGSIPAAVEVDDSAPIYIPSQIKSEVSEGRVTLKEGSADAGSLSDASKALKGLRGKKATQ